MLEARLPPCFADHWPKPLGVGRVDCSPREFLDRLIAISAVARTSQDRMRSAPSSLASLEWRIECQLIELCFQTFGSVRVVAEEHFRRDERPTGATGPIAISIDPLDGSANYCRGSRTYSTTLAIKVRGRAIIGIVYGPATGDVYVGVRDGGAYRNAARLDGRSSDPSRTASLKSQIAHDPAVRPVVKRLKAHGYRLDRVGCTSMKLCAVAEGEHAGLIKRVTHTSGTTCDWGTAAGLLIAEEVGLQVRDWSGRSVDIPGEIVVGTPSFMHAAFDNASGR
jgi:fructose-1,6-bisphosphatase/inositol monophosphatase family enzyme